MTSRSRCGRGGARIAFVCLVLGGWNGVGAAGCGDDDSPIFFADGGTRRFPDGSFTADASLRFEDAGRGEPRPPRPYPPHPTHRCPVTGQGAVAFYEFEGNLEDSAHHHHASVRHGAVGFLPGPKGCGLALALPYRSAAAVVIPPSHDWDRYAGSVEFSVKFDAPPEDWLEGLISRDAKGQKRSGHFTIMRARDGRIVLRIQSRSESFFRCTEYPVREGRWIHVAVNYGPPGVELYVDGRPANYEGRITLSSEAVRHGPHSAHCGGTTDLGIAGNDNPWLIGGSGMNSREGDYLPIPGSWLQSGAIDNLKISAHRVRPRSF